MRALVVLLLAGFMAFSANAQDWSDPDLGRGIRKGAVTRDHIWLLGQTRSVVRFDRETGERAVVAQNVQDLLPNGEQLWVLIQANDPASFSLRDLRSGTNQTPRADHADRTHLYLHPSETSEGEVLGLFIWPGQTRPAVLARRAVIAPTAEGWKRWSIAASLGQAARIATPDGRSIYVGYNLGEWGGGLRRIELPTGSISFVTEASEALCGGSINPACDPVVGLFPDRRSRDCITVGTGLAHMGSSHGDVYRVCESQILPEFSTPTPAEPDQGMLAPRPWPLHGLFETADGWIGISRDRYFRSRGSHVTEHPMPAFKEWSGLRISEEQDGVLFVISACCWGSANLSLYSAIALPVF
jgi:hypothetical protein